MCKKIIKLFVLVITFFCFLTNVHAASLSIGTNYKSVVIGNTVTVTVRADGLAGKFSITSSNGNILSGGVNSVWLENETKTYKFSAKNIGSATIYVTPVDVSDSSGNVFKSGKSVTINVVKPREKSTNNNLKSLSVEGYSISPSFNKDTLEYTVDLESNVEKITINASKEDGYASVSGIGEKEVQEGDNKFQITVTSETGKSKIYTVNAVVKDSNPIVKEINGEKYTVIKRASNITVPDNYEQTTVLINNIEIPAFYNSVTKYTLLGLKDKDGNIDLYRYDAKTDEFTKYQSLTSISKTIVFENADKELENYVKTTVLIDDKEYTAYQYKDNKEYILIYGTDLKTGNKDWYTYHFREKTIQNYVIGDIISDIEADFNKTLDEYKIVLLIVVGLSSLLLLIIIIQIASKSKVKKRLLRKMQIQMENYENKIKEITGLNIEDAKMSDYADGNSKIKKSKNK